MKSSKKRSVKFEEGNLKDIKICLTQEYQSTAYPNGNTDFQMVNDIQNDQPNGKTILDVGTFIGASSLVFAKFVGKDGYVWGFEPNPFNRKRISENLALNPDLNKIIRISPLALSSEQGQMTMTLSSQIDNGYSSTSRLNQSHPTLHNDQLPEGFEEVLVDVTTLDKFVSEHKISPDIIKVDIEGAEYDFLLGARKTIEKYKPVFYIELHSEFCAVRCMDFLHSMKYGVTILHEEEDNRIMVKAQFNSQKEVVPMDLAIIAQRNLDASLSMNKVLQKVLEEEIKDKKILELELQISKQELINLHNQITAIQNEMDLLEEKNSALKRSLLSYANSNSWKITKPLRSLRRILHKTKTH